MRREREWVLYGAAFLVFAAAVLWADRAPWQVLAVFAALAATLGLFMFLPVRRPKVVLVGERDRVWPLQAALGGAGFGVCRCSGPVGRPCPVTLGRSCPLSERLPVAAVIFRRRDDTDPLPPCGRALWVPFLAVEEASGREPEIEGRYGRVGLDRGSAAAVQALEVMLTG